MERIGALIERGDAASLKKKNEKTRALLGGEKRSVQQMRQG